MFGRGGAAFAIDTGTVEPTTIAAQQQTQPMIRMIGFLDWLAAPRRCVLVPSLVYVSSDARSQGVNVGSLETI